eukprot:TRINITY_DN760_c0_g1_i6.p1 TRINITY_DN760_c0_g1~~TRINITY_DN760_c0_g1_i6.p1  ORF type:complete len:414 (+),score=148.81 TRINITY_DN760_c0_g1_i6:64-1305(+)
MDVVVHGAPDPDGRFRLRISFADDTMTDVDSGLDVVMREDIQEYFAVDPNSIGADGGLRLLEPPKPPLHKRLWTAFTSRWRPALVITAIVLLFHFAPLWPCPCHLAASFGVLVVLLGLLFSDVDNSVIAATILLILFGVIALVVTLNYTQTFGIFLCVTWLFTAVSIGLAGLQEFVPKYRWIAKLALPYVLGAYWVALVVYYLEFEYGAPPYATSAAVALLVPLFAFCHFFLQKRIKWKYTAMLVYVTGAVGLLATSLLAIDWPEDHWQLRQGVRGPPEAFEAVILIITLYGFGLAVVFATFKLKGGEIIPEQLSSNWAVGTFAICWALHCICLWMVLSLALEFHREGRLWKYFFTVATAYLQDIMFNEPIKVLLLTQFGPVVKTLMKVGAGKVVRFALEESGLMKLWMGLLG